MPQVSVLMSVYNSADYLSEAIESILSQTFTDFEFLIIDDGSSDESLSILQEYARKDQRVQVIENEQNMGLSLSLNKGLKLASCELVARMDADDVSEPKRLEMQVAFMRENPDVTVCGGAITVYEEPSQGFSNPVTHEEVMAKNLFSCAFAHPAVLMRKTQILELAGGYDAEELYAEDFGLWARLAISGKAKFANLRESLLRYRLHPDQPRKSYKDTQLQTAFRIVKKQFSALGVAIPDEDIALLYQVDEKLSRERIKQCEKWMSELEQATKNISKEAAEAYGKEIKRRKMGLWRHIERNSLSNYIMYLQSRMYLSAEKRKSKDLFPRL